MPIEDRLQEDVPASIKALRMAGLKVWVITGDKVETAINIGYASQLLEPNEDLIQLTKMGDDKPLLLEKIRENLKKYDPEFKDLFARANAFNMSIREGFETPPLGTPTSEHPSFGSKNKKRGGKVRFMSQATPRQSVSNIDRDVTGLSRETTKSFGSTVTDTMNLIWKSIGKPDQTSLTGRKREYLSPRTINDKSVGMVIDGKTLKRCFDADCKTEFLRLSQFCKSVLICRATPKQKGDVVKLVKQNLGVQTLAIGM